MVLNKTLAFELRIIDKVNKKKLKKRFIDNFISVTKKKLNIQYNYFDTYVTQKYVKFLRLVPNRHLSFFSVRTHI
mgnify:FL=1